MLILRREVGEEIAIITPCGTMTLMITDITSCGVKIGFNAPDDFRIMRTELLEEAPDSKQHE